MSYDNATLFSNLMYIVFLLSKRHSTEKYLYLIANRISTIMQFIHECNYFVFYLQYDIRSFIHDLLCLAI